ncbi:MAG: F0F1 ATP synthase subunit B [Clostridiales Family XIII bacterium]|jgi:F-type H+-transporting ATPase subunit b|nr:F0F1 ATP synthase subunit B [Clostridiales Family XIII bacterium]
MEDQIMVRGLIDFGPTLLMNLITLIVLYLILKKFFFEKVRNFMQAREQAVKDAFDNADRVNKLADEKLREYNDQLTLIEAKSRETIKESKLRADERAREILDEAGRKAGEMITQAEREIEKEKLRSVGEMREHIASLALYAAEKILEKELDPIAQTAIIDSVIEQAENSKWTH